MTALTKTIFHAVLLRTGGKPFCFTTNSNSVKSCIRCSSLSFQYMAFQPNYLKQMKRRTALLKLKCVQQYLHVNGPLCVGPIDVLVIC